MLIESSHFYDIQRCADKRFSGLDVIEYVQDWEILIQLWFAAEGFDPLHRSEVMSRTDRLTRLLHPDVS